MGVNKRGSDGELVRGCVCGGGVLMDVEVRKLGGVKCDKVSEDL